jgi:hypothetical protein
LIDLRAMPFFRKAVRRASIRRPPCRRAFVLLEVLLSLVILGVSVAALMRSFNQSLSAAKTMERQTQAQFFAQQLLHEFTIKPPEKVGGFGDDYRNYSYRTTARYIEPKYRKLGNVADIEQYFAMQEITIEILYEDSDHKPFVLLRVDSALPGFEKFSAETKRSYGDF